MITPLVSIIIPTFNRATLIGKALDSVINQTYTHWECLVIDDGSTDDSMPILEHYHDLDARVKVYKRNREPKGAPTCRNIGLHHAQGDYIIFLDSDDYLLPFCLLQRVKHIQQFPEQHFLVFPMGEEKDGTVIKREIPHNNDYLVNFLSANLPWQTMCPIWKKSFLIMLHGFTEGYPRFNDPELMIRALLVEQVTFKVFNDTRFDCVHYPSPKVNIQFKNNTYKSMCLLIPDIVECLEKSKKMHFKKYMANYLHLWFKYFYIPLGDSNIRQSFNLIYLFFRKGIISISMFLSLIVRLCIYAFTRVFFKHPINKLTERAFYINKT